MNSKKFQRTIEDFACEKCGFTVKGTGYTNHCPQCLWSKHVDVNPGDRAEDCGGMMEPVGALKRAGKYEVLQRCIKCGFERKNKLGAEDNFQTLVALSEKLG